jgi:15-cis-phytoene synthase
MQDAYRHCEALVREADHDRFIAALFAPVGRRAHLHALHAFDIELARVGHVVREALAGEIRLQWWRDALAGEARGDAMANPVAAALIDTVARCSLPADALNALIDARAHDLYGEPFATLDALDDHARRTASIVLDLAARILDREGAAGPAAAPGGIAMALADALQNLPREAARGRISVPLDLLDRHGVAQDSIYGSLRTGTATAPLAAALAELARKGRTHLDEVRRGWASVPPQSRPAFLPLAVTDALLARAERNTDPLRPAGLAPWRRQWRIWRAARRGRL